MPQLNIQAAYDYYDKHINRQERFDLLEEHNFPIAGSIPSIDWELFGALLTGDEKKEGYGSDLKTYEVKSAIEGGSFEYQYHKHGGLAKLDEDKSVSHIFITYSRDYKTVTVRLVAGSKIMDQFESWRDGYVAAYKAGRQRYRKNIALGYVLRNGETVMEIAGGALVQAQSPAQPILEPTD